MAKTRALARPIIITAPRRSPGRLRRAGRRAVHYARRAGGHARRNLPVMGSGLGALALGYAQAKGHLDKLPKLAGSVSVTMAVAGYFGATKVRTPWLRDVAFAALVAGAFDFGRVQGGGTSGLDDASGYDAGGGPYSGM